MDLQKVEVLSHFCILSFFLSFKNRKLTKFRGKDHGKSKLNEKVIVNPIVFPEGITLKSIFLPHLEGEEN